MISLASPLPFFLSFLWRLLSGVNWEGLEKLEGHPIDIQPTIDLSSVFDEKSVAALAAASSAFENF